MATKKAHKYVEDPEAESQIVDSIRSYDYDTIEYPIEVIINKYRQSLLTAFDESKEAEGSIIYVPDYQREYVWENERKSKFIESILIGVPIPLLFFADVDGKMEIVDGSQRIRSLNEFIDGKLKLKALETLDKLNGKTFYDLSPVRRRRFLNTGLRAVFLSEKTDSLAKLDLFERINTGSDELKAAEIRKGAYAGDFWDFINECSAHPLFIELCPINKKVGLRAEGTERVLRFFAYSETLAGYNGKVSEFLDKYMKKYSKEFDENIKNEMKVKFERMLSFVNDNFPYGFRKFKTAGSAPRLRFEAIAVGVAQALKDNPELQVANVDWLYSEEFQSVTRPDAANNKAHLFRRIDFVKLKLTGVKPHG
jgi:uncharacterized protein with ParB-like and HNH nuclease domain